MQSGISVDQSGPVWAAHEDQHPAGLGLSIQSSMAQPDVAPSCQCAWEAEMAATEQGRRPPVWALPPRIRALSAAALPAATPNSQHTPSHKARFAIQFSAITIIHITQAYHRLSHQQVLVGLVHLSDDGSILTLRGMAVGTSPICNIPCSHCRQLRAAPFRLPERLSSVGTPWRYALAV